MDESNIVGIAGLGLVAVNFWTSEQRNLIGGTLWGDKENPADAHKAFLGFAGEMMLVGLAFVLAGISAAWARAMLALMVALWVLWAVTYYSRGGARSSSKPSNHAAQLV